MSIDQRGELLEIFVDDCIECILQADDGAELAVGLYLLSTRIEDRVAEERKKGNNLRHALCATVQHSSDTSGPNLSRNLVGDERHLTVLRDDIVALVKAQLGDSKNYGDEAEQVAVATVLTTTLIGIHSARFDANWQGIETTLSWCNTELPRGYKYEKYALLRSAEYFGAIGRARFAMVTKQEVNLPNAELLNTLLNDAEQDLHDTSFRDNSLLRMRLFLADAVAQLPPELLRSGSHASWLNDLLKTNPRLHARFKYNLSRARFAQNKIGDAIRLSIEALLEAPPDDLPFIECVDSSC